MTIPAVHDSLIFARRCVAAFFLGQEERLRTELSYAGVQVTVESLRAHGELWSSAFRQDDLSKHDCFLCGTERPPGTLCACFRDVMPTRYYNVNDPMVLGQLTADTVVETYVCTCCGGLEAVTAGQALRSHQRAKAYVPRKLCEPCFRDSRPRKRKANFKKPRTHLREELEARLGGAPETAQAASEAPAPS